MKYIIEKLKPLFFLLGLTIICVGIVWITRQFQDVSTSEVDYGVAQQVPVVVEEVTIENSTTDTSLPSKVSKDNQGYVLAATAENGDNVCPANTISISSQSVCSRQSSGPVDYTGGSRSGTRVSKSSTVILSAVKVPLDLYSGMDVKDSNRLITSKTPTFKAAGEQIDETSANIQLPPGSQVSTYKSWVEDEPFSTKYTLAFAQKADEPTDDGELGVDTKLENQCEDCNNKSNINPSKSNALSEFMFDKEYRTPGEKEKVQDSDVIEDCNEEKVKFIEWGSQLYDGCYMSIIRKAVALFQTIGDLLWNNCTADPNDDDNCVYVEDIVIMMESPFGSDKDCNDGTCTNAYMTVRNKSALEPSADLEGKVYYTTDCWAIIEGAERAVTCAWDMSHLFKERKVSELDDIPTVDSTPSDEAYNKFLLEQVKDKRGLTQIPL